IDSLSLSSPLSLSLDFFSLSRSISTHAPCSCKCASQSTTSVSFLVCKVKLAGVTKDELLFLHLRRLHFERMKTGCGAGKEIEPN
uniref:Uncharacterized protein n=1 Tax=Oryza brachyantha TaxID=4533 RepID=J3MTG1_ORYBR